MIPHERKPTALAVGGIESVTVPVIMSSYENHICMVKTIKIPVGDVSFLKEQASRYAEVFNHVVSYGLDNGVTNGVELHHRTYYTFAKRENFLPSQLIISARVKATETIKGWLTLKKKRDKQIVEQQEAIAKGKHIRHPLKEISRPLSRGILSIRYDARSFKVDFKNCILSFSSIQGRQRINFNENPYYSQYTNVIHKVCSADLCWSKKSKSFFFHIVLEFPDIPTQTPSKVLGVDLGINNLAVSSDGKFYLKHHIRDRVSRYRGLKSRLQSKGTPSAKRHLKAVAGKEHRFRRDVNHCVTKQIVAQALKYSYDTVAVEDLEDIRDRRKELSKSFHARLHSWPFEQFRGFLTYKALASGIGVKEVSPRHTSQRCSRCGHVDKTQRDGNSFHCVKCGYREHADLNAALNISKSCTPKYCLPEVQPKETPGYGRHVCPNRAEDQPAYCSDGDFTVTVNRKPTTLVVGS